MFFVTGLFAPTVNATRPRANRASKPRRSIRPMIEHLEARDVPTLLGDPVFPADNPWNQRIDNAPVAANSAAIIQHIVDRAAVGTNPRIHADFGHTATPGVGDGLIGIPWVDATAGTPQVVNFVIDAYADESDIVSVSFDPTKAVIEGMTDTGVPASGGDRHLLIYNKNTNILYEFYNVSMPSQNADGRWHADQESVWDLSQNSFRPLGWTSSDAAGLPVLPGLVRPEEVLDEGVINHAIRFTVVDSLNKFIYPASHKASSKTGDLPAMGERFRLRSDFVIPSTWPTEAKVIAQAMKTYGLILADNGSDMFVTGAPSSRWIDDNLSFLRNIRASDFQVVDLTPRITSLSVSSGSTAGGTSVIIAGLNFSGAAGNLHVLFGNTEATSVVINSDSQLTVVAPAHAAGTVDIRVQSGRTASHGDNKVAGVFGYGTSAIVTADRFTYTAGSNAAPTVASAASASPGIVTGLTTNLAVLGADDGGEAALTYTWSATGPASVTFSANGTNAAKNSTATFTKAGSYTFTATIRDAGGLTVTSSVNVTVNQTLTSIGLSPASASVAANGTQQFTATAKDQFGVALVTQPGFTWSVATGGGTVSTTGLYTAPGTAGSATVRAASGAVSGTAAVTIAAVNGAPTVATGASAAPNPVGGTSTALSVLGADDGGEAALTYTWSATGPAAVTFGANGTNAAKNSSASFTKAGAYSFTVTIRDAAGLTASSSVNVTVNQTLTSIAIAPSSVSLNNGVTQQFTATARDQFGATLTTQPAFTWSLGTGSVGTLSTSGLYTAPASGTGTATVRATSGAVTGTAAVTVTAVSTAPAGLKAEFFDYTSSLSVLPNLSGRVADVVRTDAQINYGNSGTAWTGLDSRFADTFATRHTGFLKVNTAGSYTFYLNSDDGSKLWIDGALVVNNDNLHGLKEVAGTVTLSAGYHNVRVEFFENGGSAGLILSWSGPGIAKQVVPASAFFQSDPATAFQQDTSADRLVVMEAENFQGNTSQGGKNWVANALAGFAGTGAMQSGPNTGVINDTGYLTASPRLDYRINFTQAGTYYVWIRGVGPTGSDDSVHIGLDGAAVSTGARVQLPSAYGWSRTTMDGTLVTINVTTPGIHTLNLWMREDGAIVDRILVTSNANYTPTGTGPAESVRR